MTAYTNSFGEVKDLEINEQPHRKPNRLAGFDYSTTRAYFVTLCVQNRRNLFWSVGADSIRPNLQPMLSQYGKIVDTAIQAISTHYDKIIVEKYCIMPDHVHMSEHVHMILFLLPGESRRMISAPTLPTIIGQMKRWVSKQVGFPLWQKSFYDHIIRDDEDYENIWKYIDENPNRWLKEDNRYEEH